MHFEYFFFFSPGKTLPTLSHSLPKVHVTQVVCVCVHSGIFLRILWKITNWRRSSWFISGSIKVSIHQNYKSQRWIAYWILECFHSEMQFVIWEFLLPWLVINAKPTCTVASTHRGHFSELFTSMCYERILSKGGRLCWVLLTMGKFSTSLLLFMKNWYNVDAPQRVLGYVEKYTL